MILFLVIAVIGVIGCFYFKNRQNKADQLLLKKIEGKRYIASLFTAYFGIVGGFTFMGASMASRNPEWLIAISVAGSGVLFTLALMVITDRISLARKRRLRKFTGLSGVVTEIINNEVSKVKVYRGTEATVMKAMSEHSIKMGQHIIVESVIDPNILYVTPVAKASNNSAL